MKKKRIGSRFLICVLMVSIFITGCTSNKNDSVQISSSEKKNSMSTDVQNQESSSIGKESISEKEESVVLKEQKDQILVISKFGTMEYPNAFSDVIDVVATETSNTYIIEFSGNINEINVPLFTVAFSSDNMDNMDRIGTLKLEEGSHINIFLTVCEPLDGLTEDELNTFYAAQEVVNNILTSIYEFDGFEKK